MYFSNKFLSQESFIPFILSALLQHFTIKNIVGKKKSCSIMPDTSRPQSQCHLSDYSLAML